MTDRRSGKDRRRTQRVRADVGVRWSTADAKGSGKLNDLSTEGCFVLTAGEFTSGQRVMLRLLIARGKALDLEAEVSEPLYDVGFAARFVGIDGTRSDVLRSLIEFHGKQ